MMRKFTTICCVWMLGLFVKVQGQQVFSLSEVIEDSIEAHEGHACGAHHVWLKQGGGEHAKHGINAWMQQMRARLAGQTRARQVLTIPLVFHIIHNGEPISVGDNISEQKVIEAVEILNEDFRNIPGTPGFSNNPLATDTEIEFCLAYIDENEIPLPEQGINRVSAPAMGFTEPPYSINYINSVIKPATQWDPTKYFNVWVVSEISGGTAGGGRIAGFAQFPPFGNFNPSAITDGIVAGGRGFVGRNPLGSGNERVLTHEVGHALGLFHIAEINSNCSSDDGCGDTPASDGVNQGCAPIENSCGNIEQVENYMVATVGTCRNIFTPCQTERMRTVMQSSPRRVELLNSKVCELPTAAPEVNFGLESNFSCDGTFQFRDLSTNFPSSWFWIFSNGQIDSVKNPVIRFEASGTYTVTLIANNFLGSSSFSGTVTVEIGGAPSVSVGDDITACIGDQILLQGEVEGEVETISWSPSIGLSNASILNPTLTATTSRTYILSAEAENDCVSRDTLNISVVPTPTTFAIGDATINEGDTTQLNAFGAESFSWTPEEGLSDPTIANPRAFPTQTTTYVVNGANGGGCERKDSVVIVVNRTTSIDNEAFSALGQIMPIYPNPSRESVNFSADFRFSGQLRMLLVDLSGHKVSTLKETKVTQGDFHYEWKREAGIAAGMYFIVWELNGVRFVQRIEML